jgi:hypothetical protein
MRFLKSAVALVLCATASAEWLPSAGHAVKITPAGGDTWRVLSDAEDEFTLDSSTSLPVRAGEYFEVTVRLKVDLHTRALPELACFDAGGHYIPGPSALDSGPSTSTTNWQTFHRIFAAQPGAATVRARIRAEGRGEISIGELTFAARRIDPYQTGALVSQIYPRNRRGLVLESNFGIVNREMISPEDRDGDGKWALILVDLDRISEPEQKGVDWRTKFEYRPNEIYWSDGAVLKSDSVLKDRAPDRNRALHFRTHVHPGSYRVILNDPGRALAISRDGVEWQRYEGGAEARLGRFDAADGWIEFWVDACYRDRLSPGPAYFDYIRIFPEDEAPAAQRLFQAAQQHPGTVRGSVEEKRVTVTAPEGPGPVGCGLPIPRGELGSAANVSVLDRSGAAIPVQSRAMAVWPDGSVKWLYLDFPQTSPPYTVVYGSRVHPAAATSAVSVKRTERGIEVDTGAVRFLVPGSKFGILSEVSRKGRTVQAGPIAAAVVEAGGKMWDASALPVAKIEIEREGPLHAVILVATRTPPSGKAASGFAHSARIHAYAGSAVVGIDYFVANTDARPKVMARSITLRLPVAPETSGEVLATTGKESVSGGAAVRLRDGGSLHLGVADFRETYPKAIRWSADGVAVALWSAAGGDYEWVQGVGKTHQIAIDYSGSVEPERLAAGPVLAVASPEWYTASGAFGPISTAARSSFPGIEKTFAGHMRNAIVGHVGLGFENYGDHSSGGYVAGTYLWDNNEYDVPAGCLIHFARTGDRGVLRLGLASASHYLDVDMIHYSSRHADWAGAAHTHSHGDVGHHTADAPNMHHAGYVQGLLLYSYLTGDPAGIAGARGIAEWVLRNISPEANVGQMERALGHPLMTLTDVYEATWGDRYLHGAARLVDWAEKWEHPVRSGFLAPITEQPAYYSGSPFCGGLITSALVKFNSWAKLPEIDSMLERVARWLLTDMWRPEGIMSKGGSPRRKASPDDIASHMRLLRRVYENTHDPLFLVLPRELMLNGFDKDADIHTRSTGLVFNYVPWFMDLLESQGHPAPDAAWTVRPRSSELLLRRGETAQACFDVNNAGRSGISGLRIRFQPRLDFTAAPPAAVIDGMRAGETAELCYTVRAPEEINLTSQYNRVAYAHWTATGSRQGEPVLAHAWIRLKLQP